MSQAAITSTEHRGTILKEVSPRFVFKTLSFVLFKHERQFKPPRAILQFYRLSLLVKLKGKCDKKKPLIDQNSNIQSLFEFRTENSGKENEGMVVFEFKNSLQSFLLMQWNLISLIYNVYYMYQSLTASSEQLGICQDMRSYFKTIIYGMEILG